MSVLLDGANAQGARMLAKQRQKSREDEIKIKKKKYKRWSAKARASPLNGL